jgi:hypothetical protein
VTNIPGLISKLSALISSICTSSTTSPLTTSPAFSVISPAANKYSSKSIAFGLAPSPDEPKNPKTPGVFLIAYHNSGV